MSLPRFLEPLGPIGECREEASQPLAGLFVQRSPVSGSNFWREKDEYLRFGHYIGWGMQEYLPRDHLSACRPLPPGLALRSRPPCDGRAWGRDASAGTSPERRSKTPG